MRVVLLLVSLSFAGAAVAEEITVEIVATINKFDQSGSCCLVPVIGDMVLGDEVRIRVTYDPDIFEFGYPESPVSSVTVQVEDHFSAHTTQAGSLFYLTGYNGGFSLQTNSSPSQGGLVSDQVFVGGGIDEYRYMWQLNAQLYDSDGPNEETWHGYGDISGVDISRFGLGYGIGDKNLVFLHFGDGVRAEAVIVDINYIPPQPSFSGVKIDVNPFTNGEVRPLYKEPVYVVVHGTSIAAGDAIDFHPNQLKWDSVRFGPDYMQSTIFPWALDVDNDGDTDAVFSFDAYDAEIACGDTEVNMLGATWDGEYFESVDTITTKDCEAGSCHP